MNISLHEHIVLLTLLYCRDSNSFQEKERQSKLELLEHITCLYCLQATKKEEAFTLKHSDLRSRYITKNVIFQNLR